MEPSSAPRPAFAHASEAEFARILDFYQVRWEYEPHVFPILWNLDGLVVESFSPDFWLPDLELYVEMTTLKQSLVRKKNRKLRRLRELYPDIRIKLFYGRDFRALMLKYGKLGLFAEMSGTPGQATPPRGLHAATSDTATDLPTATPVEAPDPLAARGRARAEPVAPMPGLPAGADQGAARAGRRSRRRGGRPTMPAIPLAVKE